MQRDAAAEQAVPAPGRNPQDDFEVFWNHHYRYYLTVLMAVGATKEDAHDAIGDVIGDMLKKNTWVRLTTNPKAWVRKAVLHTYYDRQKKQRVRFRREFEGHLAVAPDSYVDDGPNVWEDWQWVQQMLSTLPPTQRTIFELAIADFGTREIADVLGKNPDAVRQNLTHARKRLRANLGKDYQIGPATRPAPARGRRTPSEHR